MSPVAPALQADSLPLTHGERPRRYLEQSNSWIGKQKRGCQGLGEELFNGYKVLIWDEGWWLHNINELNANELYTQFKKLREILDSEERKELQKLKAEETAILCTMANSENELVQQSQLVRDLISDVEHHLQEPKNEMLQVKLRPAFET